MTHENTFVNQLGHTHLKSFALMCACAFIAQVDIQTVNLIVPRIGLDEITRHQDAEFANAAYFLGQVIIIPLAIKLTRYITLTHLYCLTALLFAITSIAGGQDMTSQICVTLRIAQNILGGTLLGLVIVSTFLFFPGREMIKAAVVVGTCFFIMPIISPDLNQWPTVDYSWHLLFAINILPGLAAALGTTLLLRAGRRELVVAQCPNYAVLIVVAFLLAVLDYTLEFYPNLSWLNDRASDVTAWISAISCVSVVELLFVDPAPGARAKNYMNSPADQMRCEPQDRKSRDDNRQAEHQRQGATTARPTLKLVEPIGTAKDKP